MGEREHPSGQTSLPTSLLLLLVQFVLSSPFISKGPSKMVTAHILDLALHYRKYSRDEQALFPLYVFSESRKPVRVIA